MLTLTFVARPDEPVGWASHADASVNTPIRDDKYLDSDRASEQSSSHFWSFRILLSKFRPFPQITFPKKLGWTI